MYNSLQDPNVSLACNLLDSMRILDEKVRPAKSKSTGFGPDINNDTFSQLFSMGCYLSNALRGEGLVGIYRSLPFAYYYSLRQIKKLPRLWISVRMLSLLPKFAAGKHKRVGAELIPKFMSSIRAKKLAFDEFSERGGHHTHCGLPLSFTPEMDSYWLGEMYVDVFAYLEEDLKKILIPMSYAEYEEPRPYECDSESSLLGNVKQFSKDKDWLMVSILFFALFFPDRLRQVVDPDHDHGLPYTSDGWLRFLGDTLQFAPDKACTLFLHGMNAVYLTLGEHGADVKGRSA